MRLLDLFAGIGGFSLAAHWAGWETAAFVEWEKYPQKVLAKNFPGVPIYSDIKKFNYEQEKQIGPIDIITGGFPCQPFSTAGKRQGTNDDRYLWPEMLRVIREVKPAWVVGENVAGLLTMDSGAVFEEVCASLEDEGYQVESFVLPAISCGAPHRRDRVWIVANMEGRRERLRVEREKTKRQASKFRKSFIERVISHPDNNGHFATEIGKGNKEGGDRKQEGKDKVCKPAGSDSVWGFTTDPNENVHPRGLDSARNSQEARRSKESNQQKEGWAENWKRVWTKFGASSSNIWRIPWYEVATRICRVDDGLPSWVDGHRTNRLKALGNSIVPQVAYEIFRAINEVEKKEN